MHVIVKLKNPTPVPVTLTLSKLGTLRQVLLMVADRLTLILFNASVARLACLNEVCKAVRQPVHDKWRDRPNNDALPKFRPHGRSPLHAAIADSRRRAPVRPPTPPDATRRHATNNHNPCDTKRSPHGRRSSSKQQRSDIAREC